MSVFLFQHGTSFYNFVALGYRTAELHNDVNFILL